MQKKKRMVRTLFFVTFLSIIMLFFNAGKSLSADSPKCDPGDPCVGWGRTDFANPDVFLRFLKDNKISIVTFVDRDGRVFISDSKGGEIKPCTDKCPQLLGKKILSFSQSTTHVVTASWPCILIKIGGWAFWWDVVNNRPCSP